MTNNTKSLEIYIHIPFCKSKCKYCDFLSVPTDDETKHEYVNALIAQIKSKSKELHSYNVDTLFIGGGTPSILKADYIEEIMTTVRQHYNIFDNAEITIECNPGTVTKEKLSAYRRCGINRISFGLQSTDNKELKFLGRIHTYEEFLQSYNMARECGFDNINIDLMSALPFQTVESYKESVLKVVKLDPEHISAYSLIIEESTPISEWIENETREGHEVLPNEDDERTMYYLTKEILEQNGYHQYEISNFAKEGMECKHNIGYWKRKDYIGFGIGAASLVDNNRFGVVSEMDKYIDILKRYKDEELEEIYENRETLTGEEQMEEFMFLGLRMIEGVSRNSFKKIFNRDLDKVYGEIINKLVLGNLMESGGDTLRLTPRGIDISNRVLSEFLL
ncbi:MAG: radical SAM family heme chaperone HemW [Lachnospiraceae bacterium]|nr:radical SAM family heme chaperone HemW [Lachnospiraceae bacterium]